MLSLSHDNINVVTCLGISISHQRLLPDLVMELMFASLAKVVGDVNPLNFREKVSMLQGAARGLAYLHLLRCYHADIKTANIMLDRYLVPKIADMGQGRFAEKTNTVVHPASPTYCAPERLDGTPINPFKSDICTASVLSWWR